MLWLQTAKHFDSSVAIRKLLTEASLRQFLFTVTALPLSENPLSTSALSCAKKNADVTTENMVGYFVWSIPSFINSILLQKQSSLRGLPPFDWHHSSFMSSTQNWFHSLISLLTFTNIAVNLLPSIRIPHRDKSEM